MYIAASIPNLAPTSYAGMGAYRRRPQHLAFGLGYMAYRRGLGDDSGDSSGPTAGQIAGTAGAATSIITTDMNPNIPTSTKIESSAGAALLAAAMYTPPPVDIALAIAGAFMEVLAAFGVGSGCGQTCVLSTAYANQAEAALRKNIDGYFNGPRYASQKAFALQAFDTLWNDMVQQCSNPSLGTAGQHCISDRASGSCKWKQTGQSPWPGGPQLGQCWNWWNAYRDPIANDVPNPDPPVFAPSPFTSGTTGGAPAAGTSPVLPLLALAAIVGLAVMA